MVRTCPSGALAFRKDGADEMIPPLNRITVLENGPLALAGEVSVEEQNAEPRVTLCRCGLSKNKPYCDYSHVEGGFEASGEPKAKTPPLTDDRGGPLKAFRIPDGPLKLEGNLELTTGTGVKIGTHEKAFLCRCGASQNKPYCDGSHKAAGFSDT